MAEAAAAAAAAETATADQPGTGTGEAARPEEVVVADLLVEEVSIDGMCGVY